MVSGDRFTLSHSHRLSDDTSEERCSKRGRGAESALLNGSVRRTASVLTELPQSPHYVSPRDTQRRLSHERDDNGVVHDAVHPLPAARHDLSREGTEAPADGSVMTLRDSLMSPCPDCHTTLEMHRLNMTEAILMCPSAQCVYPFNRPQVASMIVAQETLRRSSQSSPCANMSMSQTVSLRATPSCGKGSCPPSPLGRGELLSGDSDSSSFEWESLFDDLDSPVAHVDD